MNCEEETTQILKTYSNEYTHQIHAVIVIMNPRRAGKVIIPKKPKKEVFKITIYTSKDNST